MQAPIQVQARRYDYTEMNAMWNAIGNFLKLWNEDNVYIYGKYSYLCEIADTSKLYIMKRNDRIFFENYWYYYDEIVSVHCYQLIDMQGRVIANPLKIRGNDSDNTNPFEPRKALYMSITVRNYTGPEVPNDFENPDYTHEYYFMKNGYGIFTSTTGFGLPQNMHLITTVQTRNFSEEDITEIVRSSYDEDLSDDEDESGENENSISNSISNSLKDSDLSHVPLM